MEIHSGKAGTYFQCRSCQVVEKAEDKKKKISKREERKLLNKYNDDGAFGSSLGDALKQALQDKKIINVEVRYHGIALFGIIWIK